MLALQTYDLSTIFLLCMLLLAAIIDFRVHRIPNRLTYITLLTGLMLQLFFLRYDGLWTALQGIGVGLLVLLPLYLAGGMGAGDVKLMAAIGSFIGPLPALITACLSLAAGGLFAVVLVLAKGEMGALYQRYMTMWAARQYIPPQRSDIANRRFPFAAALALGTIVYLGWSSQLEFYHFATELDFRWQQLREGLGYGL